MIERSESRFGRFPSGNRNARWAKAEGGHRTGFDAALRKQISAFVGKQTPIAYHQTIQRRFILLHRPGGKIIFVSLFIVPLQSKCYFRCATGEKTI